uniref:Uncharacterized protein n=1 Tax=Arundo donax TaxID=35708 RepID=A0A0A9GQU1_ARUDO
MPNAKSAPDVIRAFRNRLLIWYHWVSMVNQFTQKLRLWDKCGQHTVGCSCFFS